MQCKHVTLPLTGDIISGLACGDYVKLSGPIFTMRDAGHLRALDALHETGRLPFDLNGQTLFYAGPTPSLGDRPIGAVGPTTASRMDFATPELFSAGIVAAIGKGTRSDAVREACKANGAVYFAAVGGAAALLASCVLSQTPIAWEDLGTEALTRLEVKDFPVFVAIDSAGNDLYRQVCAQKTDRSEEGS
ncbi:MAG: TRZ/ATZ family protein [Actinobacteria bacterium]|nr:TRZ/ATZ family protein [Actinomycetota bacterium]